VVTCANPAFYGLFAIAGTEACVLPEHVASRFYSPAADLYQALVNTDSTNIELRPNRDGDALILHITASDAGLRLLVAYPLKRPEPNTNFATAATLTDPLTGLGNRLLLNEVISNWQPHGPEALSLAAIMIDLDRFKQVNDTLGHGAGDTLLKLVAKRIKSAARSDDLVIRIGGDEFVVLHTIGLQPVGAESVGKRIIELIGRPFLIDGQQVHIGASVGIAALHHGTDNSIDLLKHADLALYEAKAAGRGIIKLFEPALAQRALARRQLEIDLRRALGLREFMLMYQPQVNMTDGSLQGFEALIRWHSPARGLVSPADFIPLAEETGEIHSIGEWTLRTACKEAMSWDGHFSVAVNVSPIQFENEGIVDIVRNALAITGLPPERLELEITEGVLMKDYAVAQKHLLAIQALGVGIAMDDFGTGYSSLSYLNSFPFSKLKIDQSFVRKENSPKSRALVHAIISLGASLNMKTIAEGVETEQQFQELAAGGCLEAQGYLISRPIPPKDIADFISDLKKTKFKGTNNE
ncbi:MAG: bifunctional diguanylate cyclase/phosphodiesterase, partial [Methylococcales bacterium]